jgi:hypothetical protein
MKEVNKDLSNGKAAGLETYSIQQMQISLVLQMKP